jgi:hypothetical protein
MSIKPLITIKHQYNANGSHRIVELDNAGFLLTAGEWVGYNNIAVYIREMVTYICATDYFKGTLKPDVIYLLVETGYKSETRK